MFTQETPRQTETPQPLIGLRYRFGDVEAEVIAVDDLDSDTVYVFYRYANHAYAPGEANRMPVTDFCSTFSGVFETQVAVAA